ncbi:MAG TPA: penicillin acylase family protein, partial [Actinomycetota bacterium]|nr:penicillin acylase family protein [Actinomycetota bacterium]
MTKRPLSSKRMRSVAVVAVIAFLVASFSAGAGAADAPPTVVDDITGWAIDPPGQCGFIDQTTSECAHYSDQLDLYASLVNDDNVTEAELPSYFKPFQFGPGTDFEDPYSPADGITIYRDAAFGVPHIYADSLSTASYGLGYASAEDRLWEMDVFRHAARGTLTEFIGDDADHTYLNRDIDTRREGYTEEEVQKMLDDLDDKFGDVGKQVQEGLQAYSDGINQYIDEAKMDPSKLPFEYTATQNSPPVYPEDWSPLDTLYLVVLQLRVFGETAGDELQNAGLYARVVDKLGKRKGRRVYNDLIFQNDPSSPTSIARSDANFHTQNLGKTNWRSVAIPDNAEDVAKNTILEDKARADFLASLGFRSPTSNAIIVSREQSATNNPLQIGAPQVGYANPGFFMDIDVHAPGIDFRGPAVPGASALIPLGRGRDYAWSLTTGYSDAVDTRAELLCNTDGSEATLDSNAYMFKGECREMESRDETFTIKPTAANPGPPGTETRTFYRTVHGPVFQRALVGGKPAAFVKERFFWKKEIDSIPAFYEWNTQIDDIDDFARAARGFTMSFNAFYADAENIGYWHVGMYPKRVKGQSP